MTIALYLTFSRILLSPLFLIVYLYGQSLGLSFLLIPIILLFLAIISELSDIFDGLLARKYNQVTQLGKLADPMADSIVRISAFFTFTQGVVELPLGLVFIFLYRDSIISTLRTLCALRGVTLSARFSGKVKAVLQGAAIIFILILMLFYAMGGISLGLLKSASYYSVLAVAIYTIYSGIEYIYANRSHILPALTSSSR